MPIRNAEKYLEECLLSIQEQSFENWELLAVNDHSTDGTLLILEDFSQKDARIKYFSNKGKGIIDALALAYKNSQGKYISRMDADDIMPPKKLELMYQAIEQNPKALITGYVQYIADTEVKAGYRRYEQWLNHLVNTKTHYASIYKECVVPSPCWLVERSILDSCGAFDSTIYPEDYDLCFRWYKNKVPIVALPKLLHIWRDHSARTSRNDSNYADNAFLELKIYYFLKIDYNKKKNLVLWGAGKKAKQVAQLLIAKNIAFQWICNNPNKIGHTIYGKKLQATQDFFEGKNLYQILITVANEQQQNEIKIDLHSKENLQEFWLC